MNSEHHPRHQLEVIYPFNTSLYYTYHLAFPQPTRKDCALTSVTLKIKGTLGIKDYYYE